MGINLKDVVSVGGEVLKKAEGHISENANLQKALFGTYSNGKPRNLADAISGEVIHPEDKLAITKRLAKHEKKKKKKESKGKRYAKIDIDKLAFNDENDD
jgi:hypothetical protein